jgi:hypothetical protein
MTSITSALSAALIGQNPCNLPTNQNSPLLKYLSNHLKQTLPPEDGDSIFLQKHVKEYVTVHAAKIK